MIDLPKILAAVGAAMFALCGIAETPGMYSAPYLQSNSEPTCQENGMDFWRDDRLRLAQPAGAPNLLNNPSFESGLRYYTFPCGIGSYIKGYENKYSVDRHVFRSGNSSLKIQTIAPPYPFDMLQSFGYPVKKSGVYTLSFYAKANRDGLNLAVTHIPVFAFAKEEQPETSNSEFALTKEWKRYSIRIKSNSTGYAFGFQVKKNIPEGAIWIDDVQFEENAECTDFVRPPISIELRTDAADNFLTPEQKIDARLEVTTDKASRSGTVRVVVRDFFYNVREVGDFRFTSDAAGNASIPLPLDRFFSGRKGVFVIRTETVLDGSDKKTVDFMRFSIMEDLNGIHRNKNIAGYHQLVVPNYEQAMKRWEKIGIGSTNYFYYNFHSKLLCDILKKYHIEETTTPLRQHWDVTLPGGATYLRNDTISIQPQGASDQNAKILVSGWREWETVTPEQEKQIEDAAEEFARYYDWHRNFSLDHEMKNRLLDNGNYDDFVKILIACARGVKRANPQNQAFLEGGAANVMGGIALTENLLTAARKVAPDFRFDRFAVHAYGHPENEDFDLLLTRYLEMLDRNGYGDAPLYVNEGGYFSPFCIPKWNLTPYRPLLMDHYQLWALSYDMGWGERISAALTVRAWLLGLKHQDRIKQFNMWRPFIYLDTQLTPMAIQKGANTLMRLLGNASFRKEVVFAAKTRAYVFETDDGVPIAAVWSFDDGMEHGEKEPLKIELDPGKMKMRVLDLMENEIVRSDNGSTLELAISPFPIFIVGEKGKLAGLENAVNRIRLKGPEEYPPIHVSTRLKSAGKILLEVSNLLTRQFFGTLSLSVGGKSVTRSLVLGPLDRIEIEAALPQKTEAAEIRENSVSWKIVADSGRTYHSVVKLETFAVERRNDHFPLDGNPEKWNDLPWLPITGRTHPRDDKVFDARFKTAWDDQFFYLLVEVTDSTLFSGAEIRNSAHVTDCDTLVVYFDTLCNGKEKNSLRVDSDDYYYAFLPRLEEHRTLVYAQEACNQQLSIGVDAVQPKTYVKEVKTFFRKTKDGYRYEIAFPQLTVLPMKLKVGSVFGFGLMLWDQDSPNGRAQRLNLAWPYGASCWRSAQFWPQAILIDQER